MGFLIRRNLGLTQKLGKGLKGYDDIIGDITANYQSSITIQTSIEGSRKEAKNSAMKIEETVKQILKSKELGSLSKIDFYKINILNDNGEIGISV